MPKMTVDEIRCKGCGICVSVCPRQIVLMCVENINEKGYHPAIVLEMDKCTGCAICAKMCPDVAITVEK